MKTTAVISGGRADRLKELSRLRTLLNALHRDIERTDGLDDAGEALEVLVCTVGDQTVAFPLAAIQRVVLAAEVTPVPEAPPWVPGLLSVEGRRVPVLDVLSRFQGRARELELSDVFLLTTICDERLALVVQEAAGVSAVSRSELQKPGDLADIAPFVLATVPVQDRTGLLLSISALAAPATGVSP